MILMAVFYRLQLFFFGFAAAAGSLLVVGLFAAQIDAPSRTFAASPDPVILAVD